MPNRERWRHLIPASSAGLCLNCGNNPRRIARNAVQPIEIDVVELQNSFKIRESIPRHLFRVGRVLGGLNLWEFEPEVLEAWNSLIPWDTKRVNNKMTFSKYLKRNKVAHKVLYAAGIDLLEARVTQGNNPITVHLHFSEDGFVKAVADGAGFEISIPFVESRYLFRRLDKYFVLSKQKVSTH